MKLKSKQRSYRQQRINPKSNRKKKADRVYWKIKKAWWHAQGRGACPVLLRIFNRVAPVQDVHHIRGNLGTLYIDARFWLAVSREGHTWIESNMDTARKHGWLAERGDWCRIPQDAITDKLKELLR